MLAELLVQTVWVFLPNQQTISLSSRPSYKCPNKPSMYKKKYLFLLPLFLVGHSKSKGMHGKYAQVFRRLGGGGWNLTFSQIYPPHFLIAGGHLQGDTNKEKDKHIYQSECCMLTTELDVLWHLPLPYHSGFTFIPSNSPSLSSNQ